MQISNTNNNKVSFSSYYNRIKPFKVQTSNGVVQFSEINYKHRPKISFFKKLTAFFVDNFAKTSSDPEWVRCRPESNDPDMYKNVIAELTKFYQVSSKNKHSTILVGRDSENNIVSAIYAGPLREGPTVKDSKVLFIDSIAVDPKYRGSNIGSVILNKVMESSKKGFTDVFLVAFREALPFYKKMGFKPVVPRTSSQEFVVSALAYERPDYPEYVEFVTKPLNRSESLNWFSRIFNRAIPKY